MHKKTTWFIFYLLQIGCVWSGYKGPTEWNAKYISWLTVGVNVSKLIVHVEEAPDAILSCGHWPVTRQDIFVELKMWRGFCKVQQPRSFV